MAANWDRRSSVIRWACLYCTLVIAALLGQVAQADDLSVKSATAIDRTQLDPNWLGDVRHPQTGLLSRSVRPEEGFGYFAILNHARTLSLAEIQAAANRFERERLVMVKNDPSYRFYFRKPDAEFPTFVDLFRAPEAYHGQLVTFRGHVRRIVSFSAGENTHGFQQLHEVWLYAGESQQNPVVIVCSELPRNIPVGPDVLVDFVSATGYFFKRYGYEDRTGQTRFAPLILAQTLEWNPPVKRSRRLSTTVVFLLPFGAAVVIAVICWNNSRQDPLRIAERRTMEMKGFGDEAST